MADSWTYWQREAAGQSDRGVTTQRVLMVAVISVLVALLWLPHLLGSGEPGAPQGAVGGAGSPRSACAELARLERQGIHSGPAWWDVQPECKARHKTRP
jgi:hypothetical protein